MSNNSQLLLSNQDGQPKTEQDWDAESKGDYANLPILEAKYTVPILWFTLFGPENIQSYKDPDDDIIIPYLIAKVTDAKAGFEHRLSELRKAFNNIDSFLAEWRQTLNTMDKAYIKVELYEILEMSDDGYDLLAPALRFLGEPDEESVAAFMNLTCFQDILDQATHKILDQPREDGRTTIEYLIGFNPWKE